MTDDRVAASLAHLRALEFSAHGFSFLPRQPVSSALSGRGASRLRGRGADFEELRHYRAGDDIRTLDWKATYRTGKPHVRVHREEREHGVVLLVDQRISMFFGSRRAMKSVVAAEIAALAAWRVLADGDRLGALIFDDRECFSFPPARRRDAVARFLAQLARSGAALRAGLASREEQLDSALNALARQLSHDALVIYIGDGLGWSARSEQTLQRIALHNDVVAVYVYDPAESELPAIDELIVSDGALQINVAGSRERLRDRFRESFKEHGAPMHSAFKRHGLALLAVNTVDDPAQQLRQALGRPR